jgi:hypothetical protein
MSDNNKTKITVCVTAEYDKANKQFISGDEDVKITVGDTKDIKNVEEAVQEIGKLSAPGEKPAGADGNDTTNNGDGAGKDNTVAGKDNTVAGKDNTVAGKDNTVAGNDGADGEKKLMEEHTNMLVPENKINEGIVNKKSGEQAAELVGGRSKAKRRCAKRGGTKKKKHTKRQRRYGGKTKKC